MSKINELAKKLKQTKDELARLNEKLDELKKQKALEEESFIDALDEVSQPRWSCDGYTFSVRKLKSWAFPSSDPERKQQVFDFLTKQLGGEGLEAYKQINSRSYSSILKNLAEDIELPECVGDAFEKLTVSMTKEKK